jgi:hypothetical protein
VTSITRRFYRTNEIQMLVHRVNQSVAAIPQTSSCLAIVQHNSKETCEEGPQNIFLLTRFYDCESEQLIFFSGHTPFGL